MSPIYPYFKLMDSSGSGGQYRVVTGGYQPNLDKAASAAKTFGGKFDVAMGDVYESHQYTLKIRHEEVTSGSDYATYAELERLYRLNDPGGTPSNLLTLIDHLGVSHTCYLVGKLSRQPVSVFISGTEAWYMINIELLIMS